MFSGMVADLAQGRLPDCAALRRRFDMALTKKMAVVSLPPAFWVDDPKINPRADHLFWASLLLLDRQRIELAWSVLAAERAGQARPVSLNHELPAEQVRELVSRFLGQMSDERIRAGVQRDLRQIVPEWMADAAAIAPDD